MLQPTPVQSLNTWAVVIFAARETVDVLLQSVRTACIAGRGRADIDVLVNGNPSLASELAARLTQVSVLSGAPVVNIWSIAQGDKANAWNQYIHRIWSGQPLAFFIDGYVRLNPDSVALLGEAITANPSLLGGTGLPSTGPSAKAIRASMAQHGGFHGNFCCITGNVIGQLRQRRIALPLGLYRVDSLMGALLSFGLHPENNDWNRHRILVHPTATWQTDPKYWWRPADLKAKLKRVFRQSRGMLENEAVKDHFLICKLRPEQLPATVTALVLGWVERCPTQINDLCRRSPLAKRALSQIKKAPLPVFDNAAPTLVLTVGSA